MPSSRSFSTAALLLLVAACTTDRTLGPTPSPQRRGHVPAVIALVSGNNQVAKAGELLAEPLVVRVTDVDGDAVSDVIVEFRVTSGAGAFAERCHGGTRDLTAMATTDSSGLAEIEFQPTMVGRTVVAAQIPGSRDGSISFVVDANILVIEFWAGIWNVGFIGPCPYPVTSPFRSAQPWNGEFLLRMIDIPLPTLSRRHRRPEVRRVSTAGA